MTAGEQLRREREAAGLSRKNVADPMNRTNEWLRLYETGKRPVPRAIRVAILDVIRRLAVCRAMESRQHDAFVRGVGLPRYVRSAPRTRTVRRSTGEVRA